MEIGVVGNELRGFCEGQASLVDHLVELLNCFEVSIDHGLVDERP